MEAVFVTPRLVALKTIMSGLFTEAVGGVPAPTLASNVMFAPEVVCDGGVKVRFGLLVGVMGIPNGCAPCGTWTASDSDSVPEPPMKRFCDGVMVLALKAKSTTSHVSVP